MDFPFIIFVAHFILYNVNANQLGSLNNGEDFLKNRMDKTINFANVNSQNLEWNHVKEYQNDRNAKSDDFNPNCRGNICEMILINRENNFEKTKTKPIQSDTIEIRKSDDKSDSQSDTSRTIRLNSGPMYQDDTVNRKSFENFSRLLKANTTQQSSNVSDFWKKFRRQKRDSGKNHDIQSGYPYYPQYNPYSDYIPGYGFPYTWPPSWTN